MDNRSDLELLAEYARSGTQNAFAELVFRHVDLVFTAARRQVRDPHLAEDVTQAVFLVLASKAGTIGAKVVLEGWLLNATRFAARDALRRRQRRQRYETEAAHQRSQQVQRGEPSSLSIAEQQEYVDRLDSILDSALSRLGTASRDALVLRFFHDKSFRDVGQELGIGEQAAKQRVCRGLHQLRKILAQSGLQIPLEGLGIALGARGVLPAPPGLAHAIAAVGGKAALAAGGSVSLAKGAMTLMAWTKAKIVAATVAGLLLLSGGAVVVHHYAAANRVVVLNPGDALPLTTPQAIPTPVSWGLGAPPQPVIAYSGPAITGTVLDPAGKPLAGASVTVSSSSFAVDAYWNPAAKIPPGTMATTSSDGRFELMPIEKPNAVVVRCDAGYAAAIVEDAAKPMSITVAPWARVEGVVRRGSQAIPNARVMIAQYGDEADWNRWHVSKEQNIQADENGHFVADRVVPGRNRIGRVDARNPMPQRLYSVDLAAGKTTIVNIGGDGRTLVGHIPPAAAAFSFGNGTVQISQPKMPQPANWDTLSQDQKQELQKAFWNTAEYRAWQQSAEVAQFNVKHDGTFRVDDVPAGEYQINLQVGDGSGGSGGFIETAGWGSTSVTVPPVIPDQLDVPLDVGEVNITLNKRIAIGDVVPEITGDALDAGSAHLSDYRGKYVLLYIWSQDDRDSSDKLNLLRAMNDRFGDDRFTIVGLNPAQSPPAVKRALSAQHVAWPQIVMHGWDDPRLPREYTLSPAQLFLIGPDGRLLAKNTDVPGMFGVLQRVLPAHSTANIQFDHQLPGREGPWNTDPGEDNVARQASFSLVDGLVYSSAGSIDCLKDGVLPSNSDAPGQCFFFDMGTLEGRFRVDLGSVISIDKVNTYSWHKSDRGPQVYKLYAATGDAPGFDPSPKIGTDPAACGWKQIALVDTRPSSGPTGGRYTVHITDPSGTLGSYRYLLFDTFVTETADTWGHTFYGEVEVIRQPL